jgi:hypothetical protein
MLALLVLTGCSTTDTAHTGNLASVLVSAVSIDEIQNAASETFAANGYKKSTDLSFEKVGSRWDQINYGGMASEPVWIKMQLKITRQTESQFVLGCNAFIVTDHSDNLIRDERELKHIKAGESKKILDEIKQRLAAAQRSSP